LGGVFSTAILEGQKYLMKFQKGPARYLIPIIFSLGLLVVVVLFGLRVVGPGNDVAQVLLRGESGSWMRWFPISKMLSTLLTYWAGMAGGIFAPCLSIGAAMGATVGSWMNAALTTCAVVGMAAFLSGTIQAPITSFVIIYEMTGHHELLLPLMLASIFSFIVARLLGAKHLYQSLAKFYQPMLASG
jgi:H+/Cl- antiporter ClcA